MATISKYTTGTMAGSTKKWSISRYSRWNGCRRSKQKKLLCLNLYLCDKGSDWDSRRLVILEMDYLATMVDLQAIIVGTGCLALGFAYGRHRRSKNRPKLAGLLEKSNGVCSRSIIVQPFPQQKHAMTSTLPTPRMRTVAFQNDRSQCEESSPVSMSSYC